MENATPNKSRWSKIKDSSKDEYQLIVRDVKNYKEIGTYNLTPLNLYVVITTILFIVAILVFLLIAWTPLRHYIPGYGDIVQRREINEMQATMTEMAQDLEDKELYINNLLRNIHGEAVTEEDIEDLKENNTDTMQTTLVPVSEEEMQLRREIDLEEVGEKSRSSSSATPSPGSNIVSLAQMYFAAPVKGEISAGFKSQPDHLGIDILAPQNTAIMSTLDGHVFLSEFTSEHGNVIGIQHANNVLSFYKHNSKLLKKTGDQVKAGEAIAIIGNTGTLTSGPHLHFELWHNGEAVDPSEFIRF